MVNHHETFTQLENRIPEVRIGDFLGREGRSATVADRWQRRLFEREARVSSLQRSEVALGSKNVQRTEGARFSKGMKNHLDIHGTNSS